MDSKNHQPPEPIVIYRIGSLGDTIVALPIFNAIRLAFPFSKRILLTNDPISELAPASSQVLLGGDFINDTIYYKIGTRSVVSLFSLYRQLRTIRSRTIIYIGGGRGLISAWRDWLFFRACGFSNIIGAPLTASLECLQLAPGSHVYEREAQRLARCLASLGPIDLLASAAWDLHLTSSEVDTALQVIGPLRKTPFLAINVGGKVIKNDWGELNWTTMLRQLTAHTALPLVFVGGPADRARCERLSSVWLGDTLNLCGTLTPRESFAVLKYAKLFVGHDSGPLHLAAAAGAPTIGLFGDNNPPAKWHPLGPHHRAIHNMQGVSAISTVEVSLAVLSALTLPEQS